MRLDSKKISSSDWLIESSDKYVMHISEPEHIIMGEDELPCLEQGSHAEPRA